MITFHIYIRLVDLTKNLDKDYCLLVYWFQKDHIKLEQRIVFGQSQYDSSTNLPRDCSSNKLCHNTRCIWSIVKKVKKLSEHCELRFFQLRGIKFPFPFPFFSFYSNPTEISSPYTPVTEISFRAEAWYCAWTFATCFTNSQIPCNPFII